MHGRVFILTGPSGVGKTTVAKELLKCLPNMARLITYTTRAPRVGEINGRDYHFISKDIFDKKIANGEFFEWAQVYNEWYGNSIHDLQMLKKTGGNVLLVVDIQGAKTIQSKLSEATSIFLQAESPEALMRRLKTRGKISPGDEARRRGQAAQEMTESKYCTHVVTAPEGKIKETVQALLKVMMGSARG